MEKKTSELLLSMRSKKDYDEFFREESRHMYFETVPEYLLSMLKAKDLTKGDVIKKSGLEKGYAYQIFNGTKENPSRDKLLSLAIAMRMELDEVTKLMKIAKLPELYIRDPRDSIIIYAIERKYSVMETNFLLEERGKEILY